MGNELKIKYVGSNYYSGDYYKKIESLLGKKEKYKHMICTFSMENVPVFIVELLKSNVLNGHVTIKEVKKTFNSVEEANVVNKWIIIFKDKCKNLNIDSEEEKNKIYEEDKSLLNSKFDLVTLIFTAPIYDITKFAYILNNFNNKELSNSYDNKRQTYTKNMYEKLSQTGVINNVVFDDLERKYKGNIESSLDYTYIFDDYLLVTKPTCIEKEGILTNLWYRDMEKIKYLCPNAINYCVIKDKAKVKTLK